MLRLGEGGSILDVIETGRQAIACALGGPAGNTLFISSAVATERQACREARTARIDAYLVSVPAPQ